MKKKKLFSLIVGLVMISSLSIMGCGNSQSVSANSKKDAIVYGLVASPTGVFNPLISNSTYDEDVNALVYSSLVNYNSKYDLQPDLAESYTTSKDNLTYNFKLRKNIKWSDGKPLTTKDILFTFKAVASKNYDGPLKDSIKDIQGIKEYEEGKAKDIKGIKVIDDNTIEFKLNRPYALALEKIGGMSILPEHIWSKVAIEKWKENKDTLNKPIGSGPFKVIKFENGQDVQLERNDGYYGNKAKAKKFIFKVTNADTVEGEIEKGTVDIADVTSLKKNQIDTLKEKKFNIIKYPKNSISYMGLNLRENKFKDVKVRQALMYGINRKEMVTKLQEGNGMVVNTPMLPSSFAYPKEALNPYDYNKQKAVELLKEAGWQDKNKDGVLENNKDEKFEVILDCPSGRKDQEQRALLIQSNLKDIGIKVNINNMEFSSLMQKVVGNHKFDMYMMLNMLPVDPDPTPYWYSTAASDKPNTFAWNISSYKNPEADKLMDEGVSTLNKERREEIYKKFAIMMNHDVPWVYLTSSDIVKATNPKLKNYHPNTGLDFVDVENWYIE